MKLGFRELVFFIVLLGMPVAAYLFVFKPLNAQIEQVGNENAAKQAKLDRLELARHIENLGEENAKLDEVIRRFEAKLPAEKEVEVILREVWNLATQHGLRPRSVRTEKAVPSSMYTELPIEMEILGNFDGFYSFLLDLEKLDRLTRIHEMKLTKLRDQEGYAGAVFTLSIFFEPQARAKPAA